MPKELMLGDRSGICIRWTRTADRIDINGWYDSYVGIEGESMSLGEFFDRLNITEKDCHKAFHRKVRDA